MSAAIRCPHCKAELPEKASFCARCGRRIEGWSVPENATPAMGEPALPGGEEATRQMEPTPSLLRAAAISVKKGGGTPRKRSKLPLVAAMLVVAGAGGVGGFFVMRARVRRSASIIKKAPMPVAAAPPIAYSPTAPGGVPPLAPGGVPLVAPGGVPPMAPGGVPPVAPSGIARVAPAPVAAAEPAKTIVRKNKAGKRAHVIGSVPVAVKARATASGGLPHKQVATDSKPMQMPTVQHETTGEAPPPPPAADEKQEAQAGVDADSVRLVVRQHLPQVRACYGRAFKDGSPGGAVEIGFAIGADGRAKNVRTETNTTDSEGLAHCLEARVKEWQFPRPVGEDYELIYPFVFAPGS